MCTNLLYSSKSNDKLLGGANALKAKSLQAIRQTNSAGSPVSSIPPMICNILFAMFENESNWPDIFLKVTLFIYVPIWRLNDRLLICFYGK